LFASEYVDDGQRLRDLIRPGRLIIVDLRDEYIEKDEALGLFVVMLQIFSEATYQGSSFNKLVVFDEAHKYIENDDLVSGLVEVVREMRHKGTIIMVASQDPPSVPVSLIELSSQIIMHKFNSPAWLKHIQKANAALGELTSDKMSRLGTGEAYVWSSKASDDSFTRGAVKIKCRPRITQHGGSTKTAVLEQSGPLGRRLRRTSAAKTLDPTEKGAVSYFLGLAFCKLFAAKLLRTPWLLHLDVFRPALNPVLTGRSRPDLVGLECGAAKWHAFECKGRVSSPDKTAKTKAKAQAQRLVSVKGVPCTLHIGSVTYFRNDVLNFYWRDPPTLNDRGISADFNNAAWAHYYRPIVEVILGADRDAISQDQGGLVAVDGADLKVGMHPLVEKYLANRDWGGAHKMAVEAEETITNDGYQPDGLKIVAGKSWLMRLSEPDLVEE
jgi:hypothetical protein